MSRSSSYWQKRFAALELAQEQKSLAYYDNLSRQYEKAAAQIQKDIDYWYSRFAKTEGISLTEAKRLLSTRELKEFRMTVEEYMEKGKTLNYSDRWARELERASTRFHVSRLEALQLQMEQQVEALMGSEVDGIDSLLCHIYTDGYYRTAFEIQKGIGIGWDLMQLDENKISKLLAKPWAADGANFSERIWGKHRPELVQYLENDFTQGLIRGDDPQKMIDQIAKRFQVAKHRAGNLVMTESAFFASAAQEDCLNDLGVEQYEIVATLDSRTSEICRSMDGKHFPMKEYQIGVTAPPFHNRCRSTTCPYFDDELTMEEMRAARGENGEYYTIPANMKYEDWEKAFVNGGEKPAVAEFLLIKGLSDSAEDNVVAEYIQNDLRKIPENHRTLLEDYVTEIEIVDGYAGSYNRDTKVISIPRKAVTEPGVVLHELGHALESKLDLYHDERFLAVLNKGLENVTINDIILDTTTFEKEVFLLDDHGKKFVSGYQGRLYDMDLDGNPQIDYKGFQINPKALGEYFAEGYKTYLIDANLLKKQDKALYDFIKELAQ